MKQVSADEPIVPVPVVVEVVPVELPATIVGVPVQVRDDQVAVRVAP